MNNEIKIKIILKKGIGNLLANANVSISTYDYGYITIKNFQIWRSKIYNERLQESINIQPPGKLIYGRYHTSIFIENKQKWYEIEHEIYLAYHDEKNKNLGDYEEVNPEDVPI